MVLQFFYVGASTYYLTDLIPRFLTFTLTLVFQVHLSSHISSALSSWIEIEVWFSVLLVFVKIVFLKDFKSVEEEKPKQSKDSEELLIDECNSFHSQEVNYAFYATVLFQFHFLCSRYMHTTFQIWKILATIKFLF